MSQSFFQSSYRKTPYISSKFTLSRKFFLVVQQTGFVYIQGVIHETVFKYERVILFDICERLLLNVVNP